MWFYPAIYNIHIVFERAIFHSAVVPRAAESHTVMNVALWMT